MIAAGGYLAMTTPQAHAAVPLASITGCDTAVAAINAGLTGVSRSRLALQAALKSHNRSAIKRAKKRLAAAEAQRDIVRLRIKALCGAQAVSAQAAGCGPAIDKLAATIDLLARARAQAGAARAKVLKLEKSVEQQSDAMQAACVPEKIDETMLAPQPAPPVAAPDTTGPIVMIGVKSPTNDTTPPVELSANEQGVSYGCTLDGSPYTVPALSFSLPTLSQTTHTLSCRGTDAAGNLGPAASASIIIDLVAPDTPSVGGPAGPTALRIVPGFVLLLGDPGNHAECRVDNGPYSPANQNSYTATFTSAGIHQVFCHVIDPAGNVSPDGTPVLPITIL
jgi:hypothetical protein